MNRNWFGTWGEGLDPDDFACALAALGTIHRELFEYLHDPNAAVPFSREAAAESDEENVSKLRQWLQIALEKTHGLLSWVPFFPVQAIFDGVETIRGKVFARAWRETVPGGNVRLEVHVGPWWDYPYGWQPQVLGWILDQLRRPAVGATTVWLRYDQPDFRCGWSWPLDVGLLPGTNSRELTKRLKELKTGWCGPLFDVISLGPIVGIVTSCCSHWGHEQRWLKFSECR